ncbi:unnamed protein product [Didymodactylos carnosus]|uniref:Ferritin n=1 Tax=Didymodactylos carnosus TaxID=1234261 RepID=A0A813U1T4_9BILA|nr:unnamed protein product [Didymodactylos carnosus]CAF1304032.1 unnamed protein product [Didymodactylos carnosus]CAF3607969.1 unnamed protein product [Didymodactylos carnosus]CAF4110750.1 unnamed protein product [Didymodactylos carnosus]
MTKMIFFLILVFIPLMACNELQVYINLQVKREMDASNAYLSFSHRLATNGTYMGFSEYFRQSAEEERQHGQKLIDYWALRNKDTTLSDLVVEDEVVDAKDLIEMIRLAHTMEQKVFISLNNVRTMAHSAKDYSTVHFIEKEMLEEQTTALKLIHDLTRKIERNSDDAKILLNLLDRDLRKNQIKTVKP